MGAFSPQAINALIEIVTGGPGMGQQRESVGLYRTATELTHFFGGCNLDLQIGGGSRVPAVRELLLAANRMDTGFQVVKCVIENAVDPREFHRQPEKHGPAVQYLNDALRPDGYEIRRIGAHYRLCELGTGAPVAAAIQEQAEVLDMDTVVRDTERALREAEDDPEDAITAACSMVESVCHTILREMKQPLPVKKDISHLVAEVQRHLNLSPSREDVTPDIKQILGGLSSAANGIGALRTHAGDAHGREKGTPRVDSRIARLAIHAASTLSLFLIETWQRQGEVRRD